MLSFNIVLIRNWYFLINFDLLSIVFYGLMTRVIDLIGLSKSIQYVII